MDGPDLVLRCLCGLHRVVSTTLDSELGEPPAPKAGMQLPANGTRLYKALAAIAALGEPTSGQVAEWLRAQGESYTTSEASTCLTVLSQRNYVYRVHTRKNEVGGSTWALTDACADLMEA
ncbi:hypothetical protein WK13_34775 [Burkholderia ubonensis]|nr:hypothetical protein WK13_34775 [Burkholderia ubonensis]